MCYNPPDNLLKFMRHYIISSDQSGKRLDQILHDLKPDLTRSFIQKIITDGNVFINHKKITKNGHKLKEADHIIINIPSIKEIGILAEKIPLSILYENSDLIVINKAAGMVVHPTDHGAHVSGTLVNALMHHCKDLSGIGGERRPGIIHRLDKDTSGVMVVAKNDDAHQYVSNQILKRTVIKKYITLLSGHLTPKEGSIEAPLIKSSMGGKRDIQISGKAKAKYALTHYKVIKYIKDYSLVEVQIITGRTHQIRVHFKAIGHPVCGDKMYGEQLTNEKLKPFGLQRQFLHAAELTLKLPKTKKEVLFKAPLPKDLKDVLERLDD